MRVYVAGPMTIGDITLHIRNAILAANQLRNAGHAPYVPHLNHFWHLLCPRSYEDWLDLDNQFLPTCEVLIRLPGKSLGAEREIALAKSLGIPVYFSVSAFLEGVN